MMASLLLVLAACSKESTSSEGGSSGGGSGSDTPVSGNIQGKVVTTSGSPISGVVVSDGLHCTKTNSKGEWGLDADLSNTDYVFVSTPSDYSAPLVNGTPVFWKFLSDLTPGTDGKYEGVEFKLEKLSRPEKFTVILYADPQPRYKTAGYDNLAYHALDCCSDMYKDMKEYVSDITSGAVYGIGLGDIVHRELGLLSKHREGMASTGLRNYNVIGNHDHDVTKTTDDRDAARPYEAILGPANYSFNIGNLHVVVLDDMIAPLVSGKISDSCNTGLTDEIWTWFENDMSFVPKDRIIMLCAHSPMFRVLGGSERTAARHYTDYKNLLSKYSKVFAWAGHTHSTLNYVNTAAPVIETHTLTRVTGELWTNEYLGANGTPRGYLVFDYDNGSYKWHFKPIFYQQGSFTGSNGGNNTKPSYTYRDWDYSSGKAVMKSGGASLDEGYQMQVFTPGTYGDKYLYVNVFMWDELWDVPKFTIGGVPSKMSRVTKSNGGKDLMYSYALREIREFYVANNTVLGGSGNEYSFETGNLESLFRIYVAEEHGSGTVSVKDRFGNTYSSSITW